MQHWRRQHIERGAPRLRASFIAGARSMPALPTRTTSQFFSVVSRRRLQGLELRQACDIGIRKAQQFVERPEPLQSRCPAAFRQDRATSDDAGGIAAGAGQRGCISACNHILGHDNDRNGLRGLLEGTRDHVATRRNGIRSGLQDQRHHCGNMLVRRLLAANDRQDFAVDTALCAQLIEKMRGSAVSFRQKGIASATRLRRPVSCARTPTEDIRNAKASHDG